MTHEITIALDAKSTQLVAAITKLGEATLAAQDAGLGDTPLVVASEAVLALVADGMLVSGKPPASDGDGSIQLGVQSCLQALLEGVDG